MLVFAQLSAPRPQNPDPHPYPRGASGSPKHLNQSHRQARACRWAECAASGLKKKKKRKRHGEWFTPTSVAGRAIISFVATTEGLIILPPTRGKYASGVDFFFFFFVPKKRTLCSRAHWRLLNEQTGTAFCILMRVFCHDRRGKLNFFYIYSSCHLLLVGALVLWMHVSVAWT